MKRSCKNMRTPYSHYRKWMYAVLAGYLFFFLPGGIISAQKQKIDEEYTAKIREYTTESCFLIKHVDYLPYSGNIPTPLDILGHIAGAPDILSHTADVNKYMHALADASPRVKVFPGGISEEGREMILVVVSDESTIDDLEKYKKINAKLADPRIINDRDAGNLIQEAKPVYWLTGAMHPGETGSPEMLMELAYRLAVDESEYIRTIRDNTIVCITPILEVDGRDKQVDLYMAKHKDPDAVVSGTLIFSGKYVGHDNNRDNLGLSLSLSRNLLKNFLDYHPQVLHDIHESVAYLWTASGSGPINAWIDPILTNEWDQFAFQEVFELTREGVPGVWTKGYPFGWSPVYGFHMATAHNAIARLYEVQTAGDGSTRVVKADGNRKVYCPNPPLHQILWSLRNNINLQQRGVLIAINHLAQNREKYMQNYYLKGKHAVEKPVTEGPAAYVFPADDPRPGQVARLFKLLRAHDVEIHKSKGAFSVKNTRYPEGTYIVRMDQPYSRFADMVLDIQYYSLNDPRPYDDVGWSLGANYNVRCDRIVDTSVLDVPMVPVKDNIKAAGSVEQLEKGQVKAYLINHNADNLLATFRFKNTGIKMHATEYEFIVKRKSFNPGTIIIKTDENTEDIENTLRKNAVNYGFTAYAVSAIPEVAAHELSVPRVALMHTWTWTEPEGWIRIALDEYEIPYDYISVHEIRDNPDLRSKYDVIMFGSLRGGADSILCGISGDEPIPWKRSQLTPHIGRQASSNDIRGGLEYEGLAHLRDFIKDGGIFITFAESAKLPVQFGLTTDVSIRKTEKLTAMGGIYKAEIAEKSCPIIYGYDNEINVYFGWSPVFALKGDRYSRRDFGEVYFGRVSGRGTMRDSDVVQGRSKDLGKKAIEEFYRIHKVNKTGNKAAMDMPRAIVSYVRNVRELLVSGGLGNGEELAGTPAIVDAPLGNGHIIMFGCNPMWRHLTNGAYSLVFNTLIHYDHLDAGK